MTLVKSLQRSLLRNREKQKKIFEEGYNIQLQLESICDHTLTEPYSWEHDNGYGRQTDICGNRCVYCRAEDVWGRGNFVNRREL